MGDADAGCPRRLHAGLVFGLHGTIRRVTSKVFLLSRCTSRSPPKKSRRPPPRMILQPVVAPAPTVHSPDRTGRRLPRIHQRDLTYTHHRHGVLHRRLPVLPDPHRTVGFRLGQVLASRDWRPKGAVLVGGLVYTVTDPPLRLLRKVIPSINLGGMRIDIAFLVLMVITSLLMTSSHRLNAPRGRSERVGSRRRGWSCRCGSITLLRNGPHRPATSPETR